MCRFIFIYKTKSIEMLIKNFFFRKFHFGNCMKYLYVHIHICLCVYYYYTYLKCNYLGLVSDLVGIDGGVYYTLEKGRNYSIK